MYFNPESENSVARKFSPRFRGLRLCPDVTISFEAHKEEEWRKVWLERWESKSFIIWNLEALVSLSDVIQMK